MSKIQCNDLLDKMNRLKNTCKDQSFDETGIASLMFLNNQIIANGQSRYISIGLNHDLSHAQLSFDNLHQVISKLNPDSEVDLKQFGKKITISQSGNHKRVKINLPIIEDGNDFFYVNNPPDISEMIPLPDDFSHAIKVCENSLPKDTSQPKYECYSIQSHRVVSSDGARLSIYNLTDNLSSSFMLSIKDGLSILDNDFTHYIIRDGYIDLMGSDVFSRISFIVNDSFPNVDSVFHDFTTSGKIRIDREKLHNDLSSASLFSMGTHTSNSAINFKVSNNKYTIKSQNEMGKIIAEDKAKSNISFDCNINPIFLLQAIEQLNRKRVIINVHNLDNVSKQNRFMIKENNFIFLFSSYNS